MSLFVSPSFQPYPAPVISKFDTGTFECPAEDIKCCPVRLSLAAFEIPNRKRTNLGFGAKPFLSPINKPACSAAISRTRGSGVMEFQENQNVLVLSDMWTKNKPRWYAAKVTRVIPAVRLNDFRPDYEVKLSLGDRTLVVDSDHIKAVTLPGYLLGPTRQYGLRSYVSRFDKKL